MSQKLLNLIIHGFCGPMGSKTLEYAFEGRDIGSCLTLSHHPSDVPIVKARSCVFHGPLDLDHTDWNGIAPLDEELIEKMRGTETVILEMLTRRETDGRVLPYPERKRTYLQYLRWWNHILEQENPDLFLAQDVPHLPREYVIYGLCKAKGINTIVCSPGDPLKDTIFFLDDWRVPAPGLRKRFEELKATVKEDSKLPPHLESYYQSQTDACPERARKPWYHQMSFPKLPWSLSPFKKGFWRKRLRHMARLLHAKRMFRFYEKNASAPDLTKKYIYFPLHMQPECNTCPLGGAYVNQELMIEMLSALAPEEVLIYVKEHPFQEFHHKDGMCRSMDFYRDLLAIKNVRFVPRTFSSYALIEHATLIATVTGTAAFEGLFRAIPAIMYGHRFHREAPGVFPVRTFEDCRKAFDAIFHHGARPVLSDVRLFLRAVSEVGVHGYSNPTYRPATELTDQENSKSVGTALKKKLGDILPLHP